VPLTYPAGFRGRASGALRLAGEPGRYRLTGDVDVRQSFYTAEFSAESQSLERLDWQLAALEGGALSDQIALDLNVRLAEPVRVRNATMHVDVEVRSPCPGRWRNRRRRASSTCARAAS
jgi:hypothetical protein